MILASDGLWSVINAEQACSIALENVKTGGAAEALKQKARELQNKQKIPDDISIIVVFINC